MAARPGRQHPDAHTASRSGRAARRDLNAPAVALALWRQRQHDGQRRASTTSCSCVYFYCSAEHALSDTTKLGDARRRTASTDDKLQIPSLAIELHADRRGCLRARVGGIAHDVHEQIEERIGIALEIGSFECGCEIELDTTVAQQPPLERETRPNDTNRIEALGTSARARAFPHHAQELRRSIEIFEHLAEVV